MYLTLSFISSTVTGLQNLIENVYIVDSLTALKHIFNKKEQDQDDLFEDNLFEKEDFNSGNDSILNLLKNISCTLS